MDISNIKLGKNDPARFAMVNENAATILRMNAEQMKERASKTGYADVPDSAMFAAKCSSISAAVMIITEFEEEFKIMMSAGQDPLQASLVVTDIIREIMLREASEKQQRERAAAQQRDML